MKGAYGNAGANTRFRRHRLLSLPALEDLAGGSSPPPARGAELDSHRGKIWADTEARHVQTVYAVASYPLSIPDRN